MRKAIIFFIFILVLSACSAVPEAVPTTADTESVHQENSPTEPAAVEEQTAETEEMAEEPAEEQPSGGETVYTIVPGESSVTYTVEETFLDGNRLNTAVGETTEVNGEIVVDLENPQQSSIGTLTVDISKFTSDSTRRDNALQGRFLESFQYPLVTFEPTNIEGLPGNYAEGDIINLTVTGDTTIRETTMPLTFEFQIQISDGELTGTGQTMFLMSDFGFGPISILGMLNTEDEVLITIDLVARP